MKSFHGFSIFSQNSENQTTLFVPFSCRVYKIKPINLICSLLSIFRLLFCDVLYKKSCSQGTGCTAQRENSYWGECWTALPTDPQYSLNQIFESYFYNRNNLAIWAWVGVLIFFCVALPPLPLFFLTNTNENSSYFCDFCWVFVI